MSGKIKSIQTYIVNDETDANGVLHLYEERDPEGNILVSIQYFADGSIESKTEGVFDEKNRIIEEKQYSGSDTPDQTVRYEYNESGKLNKLYTDYADGSTSIRSFSRNEAERITTIEIVDDKGHYEGKEIRRFDSESKLLEEVIYDESNEELEKKELEYDDHGRVIESVEVDVEGYETVLFYDYLRDDQGRIIKIETLNEDEEIIRTDELEYDERGNQCKLSVEDSKRGYAYTDVWEHDLENRITRQQRFIAESLTEEIHYVYNEHNLPEKREARNTDGVNINLYKYEFH